MKEMILQKCNFRCRENIYICRPLRRLRRLAVEYVKNYSDATYNYNRMERNEQCVVKTTISFVAIFQKTNKQKHSLTRKFVFLGNIVLIHRYMFSFVLSHVFWIVRISLINNIKHEASSNHSTTDYFQQCNKMLTVQYISIY